MFELIGGADQFENMQKKDTIGKNLLYFFIERISLKKLNINGADFYANYKGLEKFQSEDSNIRYWEIKLGLISTYCFYGKKIEWLRIKHH